MKKILVMLAAVATISVSMGDWVFKHSYFTNVYDATGKLVSAGSVPVFMKGTLKTTDWYKNADAKVCAFEKSKSNFQVYFSFCQPCINCTNCVSAAGTQLTNTNIYIVEKDSKAKQAYVTKVPINTQPISVTMKAGAKKGEVATELFSPTTTPKIGPQSYYGTIKPIQLVGDWNQKTWFTGLDDDMARAKVAAIIAVVRTLSGDVHTAGVPGSKADFAAGDLTLRRDDSFTKLLMREMTIDSTGKTQSNPFLTCAPAPADAFKTCTEILGGGGTGENMVENNIKKALKGYTISGL